MKVNTKVRYGLRAIMQIAQGYGGKPIPVSSISDTQKISIKYLEQIVGYLRRANLVVGHKGKNGGYSLTRPPADITLWDIITALDNHTSLVDCVDSPDSCDRTANCMTRDIWALLSEKMREFWVSFTLDSLLKVLVDSDSNKLNKLDKLIEK